MRLKFYYICKVTNYLNTIELAVYDINNEIIKHHPSFPNDEIVDHLEIGAGKTAFGKKFFPNCYLTETSDIKPFFTLKHFSELTTYDENDNSCHFIDYFADYHTLCQINRKFKTIICCNPYGYGFRNENSTKDFLNKIGRILEDEGKLFLVGNNGNPWFKASSAEKFIGRLGSSLNYNFIVNGIETIDEHHDFVRKHTFFKSCLNVPTPVTTSYSIVKLN